ncbi:DUF2726 domain-containing protein [Prosthecobacter sp.]|uniref:DUF2726 domain-containing protein n=1 Tax=Prosthecobacter sp. TaxID=1965333 RepID=UPI0037834448
MQTSPATSALSPSDFPPIPCPLLTSDESLFHACLENLTAQRCHIQCKPRLSEILQDENVAGFLKICQRHIDFLIYRKEDWLPMVAIEFEDDSPGKTGRKLRDRQLVHDIFLAQGIPLLQVHARDINQIDTLVHKLTAAWQQRNTHLATLPPPAPEPPPPPPPTKPLTTRLLTTPLTKAACSAIS